MENLKIVKIFRYNLFFRYTRCTLTMHDVKFVGVKVPKGSLQRTPELRKEVIFLPRETMDPVSKSLSAKSF